MHHNSTLDKFNKLFSIIAVHYPDILKPSLIWSCTNSRHSLIAYLTFCKKCPKAYYTLKKWWKKKSFKILKIETKNWVYNLIPNRHLAFSLLAERRSKDPFNPSVSTFRPTWTRRVESYKLLEEIKTKRDDIACFYMI